ncbi:MAG: hypothetical protein NC311_05910 [Muribaculaceae bacterium]|nr:hypothetical protein [Muribaculaceae bacterium]
MELNIDVVRGYYAETNDKSCAVPVMDRSVDVITGATKLCADLERIIDDTSNVGLIEYRKAQQTFTQCYNRFIADDEFKVNLNFVNEDDIISSNEEVGNVDVGHIYLRAPLSDLTKLPIGFGIYLRLYAPQRGLTLMEIFPRNMVYLINTETFSEDQVVRHLISVPHPVQPSQVMVVPYFDRSCIRVAPYQARERDQYYYKDTGSLIPWFNNQCVKTGVVIAD